MKYGIDLQKFLHNKKNLYKFYLFENQLFIIIKTFSLTFFFQKKRIKILALIFLIYLCSTKLVEFKMNHPNTLETFKNLPFLKMHKHMSAFIMTRCY